MHNTVNDDGTAQVWTNKAEITAFLQFVPSDEHRPNLANPVVNSKGEWAATDGHTAMFIGRTYRPELSDWKTVSVTDLRNAAKMQPTGGSIGIVVKSDGVNITVRDKYENVVWEHTSAFLPTVFPPIAQVYPHHENPQRFQAPGRATLNPEYLARYVKVCKAVQWTAANRGIQLIPCGDSHGDKETFPTYCVVVPSDGGLLWSGLIMPIKDTSAIPPLTRSGE